MHMTMQTITCATADCGASLSLIVAGAHDLSSTGQVLEDVSKVAGWSRGYCPDHLPPGQYATRVRYRLKVEEIKR